MRGEGSMAGDRFYWANDIEGRFVAGNVRCDRMQDPHWELIINLVTGATTVRGQRIVEWLDIAAAVDEALAAHRERGGGPVRLAEAIHRQWRVRFPEEQSLTEPETAALMQQEVTEWNQERS